MPASVLAADEKQLQKASWRREVPELGTDQVLGGPGGIAVGPRDQSSLLGLAGENLGNAGA